MQIEVCRLVNSRWARNGERYPCHGLGGLAQYVATASPHSPRSRPSPRLSPPSQRTTYPRNTPSPCDTPLSQNAPQSSHCAAVAKVGTGHLGGSYTKEGVGYEIAVPATTVLALSTQVKGVGSQEPSAGACLGGAPEGGGGGLVPPDGRLPRAEGPGVRPPAGPCLTTPSSASKHGWGER